MPSLRLTHALLLLCDMPSLTLFADCPAACSNPIVEASASGRQGFNYLFYIDFVGALSNPNCQNALRHLQVGAHVLVGCAACMRGLFVG
jgi:hypothetical protein